MSAYKGWKNYATWSVNFELFDGVNVPEFFDMTQNANDLGLQLKLHVIKTMKGIHDDEGLKSDCTMAYLDTVDWQEIAQHMIDEWVKA